MLKCLGMLFPLAAVVVASACKPSIPCPTPLFSSIGNEFNATQLLSELQQESQPFAHFYGNETTVLSNYTIHWFHDPDLPLDYAFTVVNRSNHSATIELGNMSGNKDTAFTVAHELAAVVEVDEGYPASLTCFQQQYVKITTDLLNMISEPQRDAILAQYHFDVREVYSWMVSPIFSAPCGEPNDKIAILDNGCLYAEIVLYWQNVLGNQGVPSDIQSRLTQCLPKSLAKGNEILAIINNAQGYDTPAKEKKIFHTIINDNQLQNDICVP